MSFWDHIKPTTKPPTGIAVDLEEEGRRITVKWDDSTTTRVSARTLRQQCPCAECVDEWTRKRTFDPSKVDEAMKVLEVGQVGNYALSFVFGDAHRTGIFNWTMLRETSEKHPA